METNTEEQALKDRLLERTRQMLNASVEEILTPNVLSCDYNDLAAKAVRMILDNNFLGILIIKEGRPFNLVSAFDLLRLAYEKVFDPQRDFLLTKVGELVADKQFIYIEPKAKLHEVLNIMLEKRVRTLPVIDGNTVVGICSTRDLMRWYSKTHKETRTGKL